MMNAIPMLGSLGSIVLVATMGSRTGGRSYIAAGMFLFATLGFIIVQLDRQRKQRAQQVTGSRTEYLRYLGNVRQVAREAADQQRRALTWHHPEPAALPSLAEERSRVWEHGSADDNFLHVRYGVCSQPLSLELVPPESAPIDQVDPGRCVGAASAARRPPTPTQSAGQHRPAGLRPGRAVRARGSRPRTRPLDGLLGSGLPRSRAPRDRRALHRAEPRALGLAEVAPPRAERAAGRRRRPQPDGHHLARGDRQPAPAGSQRPPTLRRRRTAAPPPTSCS